MSLWYLFACIVVWLLFKPPRYNGQTNVLYIPNEEIFNIITNEKNNLENACKHLIDAANEKGGNDNISVILVSKD